MLLWLSHNWSMLMGWAVLLFAFSVCVSGFVAVFYELKGQKVEETVKASLKARNTKDKGLEILVPGKGFVSASEYHRRY